jgi:TolB protein
MNSDGSEQTQLTHNNTYEASPVWSPDGKQIVFLSKRGSHFQLYLLDVGVDEEKQLTDLSATVHSPAWSPDGKYLAYIQEGSMGSQINVLDMENGHSYLVADAFSKYAGLVWINP